MPVQLRDMADQTFAAVRLAAWCNAVFGGAASLDEAADAVARDGAHRIAALAGEDGQATLAVGLGRLRSSGASEATAALPVPGDPLGLAGPRALTEVAVDAGHAVLIAGVRPPGAAPESQLALVARSVDGVTVWEAYEATTAPPPLHVREAARALREAVLVAGAELGALDVAPFVSARSGAVESATRAAAAGQLPATRDPAARRLYADATRLWLMSLVALGEEGGALSLTATERRRSALRALESASRRALVAAAAPSPREL